MIPHHHNLCRPPAHDQTNLFTAPAVAKLKRLANASFLKRFQFRVPSFRQIHWPGWREKTLTAIRFMSPSFAGRN